MLCCRFSAVNGGTRVAKGLTSLRRARRQIPPNKAQSNGNTERGGLFWLAVKRPWHKHSTGESG